MHEVNAQWGKGEVPWSRTGPSPGRFKPLSFDPDKANAWKPGARELERRVQAGRDAMERCIDRKEDQPGAVVRPGIGPVDFIWGSPGQPPRFETGHGVAKIIAKRNYEARTNPKLAGQHGEHVARAMVETLLRGQVGEAYDTRSGVSGQRVNVIWRKFTAVLDRGPSPSGGGAHWLLTGFINLEDEA